MIWQRLRAGNSSVNVQAQIANLGIGYEDAKAIALDVFTENFQKLSQVAMQEAMSRNEEFTFNYLKTLHDRHPNAVENISDPGVQSAILDAQFGYATTGDEDLGQLLVDLLVDRTEQIKRDTRQLFLNSALDVAKKLTAEHYRAISFLFYIYNCRETGATNPGLLYFQLTRKLTELWSALKISPIDVSYLRATNCLLPGSYVSQPLPEILRINYPGLVARGLDPESNSAINQLREMQTPAPLIINSLRDQNLVQVNALDKEDLERKLRAFAEAGFDIEPGFKGFLSDALTNYTLPVDEIRKELASNSSVLANVLDAWEQSPLVTARLTDVGITIGHANMRRLFGVEFDAKLDSWLPE